MSAFRCPQLPLAPHAMATVRTQDTRSSICEQPRDQSSRIRFLDPSSAAGRRNESLADGAVEEREQGSEVAVDVQEADRLRVEAELGPGQDLEGLVERSEASRERDERGRELDHL